MQFALAFALALGLTVMSGAAQRFRILTNGRNLQIPINHGLPEKRLGFTFCRLRYEKTRQARKSGWGDDYPQADYNFMVRLAELTRTTISLWNNGYPGFANVTAMDPDLFRCPYLRMQNAANYDFTPEEADRMRAYLMKGGFLWVDDFWGTRAWDQWADAMRQVLPEHPIFDIPLDHPIRETLFDVSHVPQVPGINFWRASGGGTAERGNDSPQADFRGIADSHGRIMVVMTHNTDIGDSMERESEDPAFFAAFSPEGYQVTIDMVLYALTH